MSKVLAAQVAVQNPETGEFVTLLQGEELPAWAEKVVTNPKAFEGGAPAAYTVESPYIPVPDPETVTQPVETASVTEPAGEPTAPEEGAAYPDGEPSESWTVAQLKAYAEDNAVDLGGASVKADILAAIESA